MFYSFSEARPSISLERSTLPLLLESHHLIDDVSDGIRCLPLYPLGGVGVGVQREARRVVAQRVGESFHIHAVLQGQRGEGVPIGYNKDKSDNPCGATG